MSNKDVTRNNSENGLNLINKASSYTFCKPKMVLTRSEKEELVKQLYTARLFGRSQKPSTCHSHQSLLSYEKYQAITAKIAATSL